MARLDIPGAWQEAIGGIAAEGAERVAVIDSMWAEPAPAAWRLLETLHTSWINEEPGG
ncbi:MAG: hypothetical protein M3N07_06485 [Pseudomonadota bacterium]|nr:hypothetical protein [Pseudomonadota bacterium]